jgi:hypothetical protein
MSAQDYASLRTALQPLLSQAVRLLGARAVGLDLGQLLPVSRRLLSEGPRTFEELRRLLSEVFPRVDERALGFATRMNLPLVMVPTSDRWAFPAAAAFTLGETWLDEPLSDDPSPEALVTRYLAAFGPATAADAQEWSGLGGLRSVLDDMRPRLRAFRDERGRELLDLPEAPRPDGDVIAPPRFLPEFDSLVLAHADRRRLIADEYRDRLVTKNLRVRATFLLDGFVRGTWRLERKRNTATLHVEPFEALPTGAMPALAEEGEALLRFVDEDATTFDVRIGQPPAAS